MSGPTHRHWLSAADHKMSPVQVGGVWFAYRPIPCGVSGCGRPSVLLDSFAPYYTEGSRCRFHAPSSSGDSEGGT